MNSMFFQRLSSLIGEDKVFLLSHKHVMIFGAGGVGGYAAEAIARSGVGKITLIDFDVVSESNINRQLCALTSTFGKYKTDVLADRIRSINPDAVVTSDKTRYTAESSEHFMSLNPDYIVDAIDSITDKIHLICEAKMRRIPIISCMGAGNKLGTDFECTDIYKTSVCPLAKVMRYELKRRGVDSLRVVYSKESPQKRLRTPGSAAWTVGSAGLKIAGEVICDLIK